MKNTHPLQDIVIPRTNTIVMTQNERVKAVHEELMRTETPILLDILDKYNFDYTTYYLALENMGITTPAY